MCKSAQGPKITPVADTGVVFFVFWEPFLDLCVSSLREGHANKAIDTVLTCGHML